MTLETIKEIAEEKGLLLTEQQLREIKFESDYQAAVSIVKQLEKLK